MTFRERVLVGIIASGLTLALFAPSCDPKPVSVMSGYDACLDCAIETGEGNG